MVAEALYQKLLKGLQHKATLSTKELATLQSLLEEYPFFQPLRMLLAQHAFAAEDLHFKQHLRTLALHTYNRSLLFSQFAYADTNIQKAQTKTFDLRLNLPSIQKPAVSKKPSTQRISPQEYVPETLPDKPFKPNASISLIDEFLQKQPGRPKPGTAEVPSNANKSLQASEDLVSETLAKIYVKQEKWLEAIKIYEKLGLKEPNKSRYFARQISEIKKHL